MCIRDRKADVAFLPVEDGNGANNGPLGMLRVIRFCIVLSNVTAGAKLLKPIYEQRMRALVQRIGKTAENVY